MRVIFFTRDFSPHDHRFLSALAKTEHEVFLLRLERLDTGVDDRSLPDVEQILWRGGSRRARWSDYPTLCMDMKRVIQRFQPDLIHAGPIQRCALLTAMAGFHPLVSMSWGSDLLLDADRTSLSRQATRYTLNRSDVLVGDCQAVADKAVAYGFDPRRIVLFPWGVDLAHFSPQPSSNLRARLGWEDAFVVLSLRSWESLYGVDTVVRAFVRAARQHPELRLLLLGSGSQAATLRSILMEAGMLERVHFGGQVSLADLPGYYRAADLYVSASYSDGSSVSLMEALACGLPALVSDIPGNREWIAPGVHGWLFLPGDEEALAAGILGACQQRKNLSVMQQAARQLAEQRADWSINFPKLLQAYQLALQGGASHG